MSLEASARQRPKALKPFYKCTEASTPLFSMRLLLALGISVAVAVAAVVVDDIDSGRR